MVSIARADDHLKDLSKNKWKPDPHHPDVDALNEASKLASVFERALAMQEVGDQPADFQQWMSDSKVQSATLRDAVSALKNGTGSFEDADKAYKSLSKTCTACHDAYRN